jgi:hypothetical protein
MKTMRTPPEWGGKRLHVQVMHVRLEWGKFKSGVGSNARPLPVGPSEPGE